MLRKFGFKKGEHRESEARLKLQKELFAFKKCVDHGFPNKPSALAYDPKLNIIAIGTKTGVIKVIGAPGVECQNEHKEEVSVTQLIFLPKQARLISLCSDNALHLWEVNFKDGTSSLDHIKSYSMEANKLKTISSCCLTADATTLLMGTEGGNIHLLDVGTFQLSEQIIYQDVVMQNVPDDFKVNPGAVEAIAQQPTNPDKFLIGYNRGLIVLWDNKENNADQTYNATQQLESLAWHRCGTQFMSAHADGSYVVWASNDSTKPKDQANTPYGPFPCKAITNVQWKAAKADSYIIFSGGMPRASYGDRHTISVTQGARQVVYDFTSRVIDFVVLCNADLLEDPTIGEYDDPHAIIALVEEEIVAIDLTSEGWQPFRQPYLCSVHSSAITTANHVSNVPEQLWTKISDAGEQQMSSHSTREWPIMGGKSLRENTSNRDLFLTGHEDGTVRFWDASSSSMQLMYKLSTASVFGSEIGAHDQTNAEGDEEWPPFRKVGTFDPYSDDPRLGVQKLYLCPLSETLVVGGTAGQIVVMQFEREEREQEVKVVPSNIVSDRDNFVWKGHDALSVRGGDVKFAAGFQPSSVVQLHPPASITSIAVHSQWQLLAVGTAHGLSVYDYAQKKEVTTKCTLNPNDLTGTGDSAMSRRKSFKKSLRESFRRLRKRRSERRRKAEEKTGEQQSEQKSGDQGENAPAAEGATGETSTQPASEATTPGDAVRSIERAIEARTAADDGLTSMVRFLYFADTFLNNAQNHTPILSAGTNAGTVFMFQITLPNNDKRETEGVQCQLAKEIHLKHHAPVLSICVIDRNAAPLPAPLEVENQRAKAADMTGSHQIIICSEEQLKIFSLPSLGARNKFKLTAHEGSKIRKVGFVNFRSKSDEQYSENDIALLTNQGDLHIFSVPHLRRQLKAECIRKENVTGIGSCAFTQNGEGFYLLSPSEFTRFSLSARLNPIPLCQIEVEEGIRPPAPEPEVVAQETQEEQAEQPAATDDTATAVAAGTEVVPASESAADGAAEGDRTEEQAGADGANDSIATGDMTIDSVRVHLSEDSSFQKSELVQSSMTTTVVTRTIVQESSTEGTTVVRSETTTVQSSSSEAGAASGDVAQGIILSNLDDDTKISKVSEETNEASETAEQLEELRITEEGDEEKPAETSEQTEQVEAAPAAAVDSQQEEVQQQAQTTVMEEVTQVTEVEDVQSQSVESNETQSPVTDQVATEQQDEVAAVESAAGEEIQPATEEQPVEEQTTEQSEENQQQTVLNEVSNAHNSVGENEPESTPSETNSSKPESVQEATA